MMERNAGLNQPKAVIAGGGLAGLACAKRLIDAGYQVELVEAEPQLGGRTASWFDEDNDEIESGIHTFFGGYTHLIRLLGEVGVNEEDIVSYDTKVGFLQPGARVSIFGTDPIRNLPRTVRGIIGNNRLLGPVDKLTVALTFLTGLQRRERYEGRTVRQLARDGGVDRRTYERLFRPLARGLAFCEPEELSAYVLLTLVSHGILNPFNLRAGTFRGGMTSVMIAPLAQWLERHGATLRTDSPLQTIHLEGRGGSGLGEVTGFELESGELLQGDVYVSALPLEVFKLMIPRAVTGLPYFQNIQNLETVPAIAVQLWFDRSFVGRDEFFLLADSPMVVFQDEAHLTFPRVGSRISLQITDRSTDGYSDDQYIDLALQELHKYVPSSLRANLEKAVVVRHEAIAIKPGVHYRRPLQTTPVNNFYLAGDYTRQDWFTTMEGATRSGEMAANEIVRRRLRPMREATIAYAVTPPLAVRRRTIR